MVKSFKSKVDFTGVAVLLMAFFVAVGFTVAKEMQETDWYEVNPTGSSPHLPENQEIGSKIDGEPTGDCEEEEGMICAIELTIPQNEDVPETVADARSSTTVNDLDSLFFEQ